VHGKVNLKLIKLCDFLRKKSSKEKGLTIFHLLRYRCCSGFAPLCRRLFFHVRPVCSRPGVDRKKGEV